MTTRIAIVGGGFAGSTAAVELAKRCPHGVEITVFDMGARGLGGRSSHRRVRRTDSAVLPDDSPPPGEQEAFEFDHGCQFFRALTPAFKATVEGWVAEGWAAPWEANFGRLAAHPSSSSSSSSSAVEASPSISSGVSTGGGAAEAFTAHDFFGCPPPRGERLYVGVDGMHTLCRRMVRSVQAKTGDAAEAAEAAPEEAEEADSLKGEEEMGRGLPAKTKPTTVRVRSGVRVQSIEPFVEGGGENSGGSGEKLKGGNKWRLSGPSGRAAFHDTPEAEAEALSARPHLGDFHKVLITDASCSFQGWHRASAGIAANVGDTGNEAAAMAAGVITARIASRLRVPLFTAMVAFKKNPAAVPTAGDGAVVPDAFTVAGSDVLWFAARSASKPATPKTRAGAVPALSSSGGGGGDGGGEVECWTLVSTAAFAVKEIQDNTMQDPDTGAFRPQENGYLNGPTGPSQALVDAFRQACRGTRSGAVVDDGKEVLPSAPPPTALPSASALSSKRFSEVAYLQGQRWGSALPSQKATTTEKQAPTPATTEVLVMGVAYDASPGGFTFESTAATATQMIKNRDSRGCNEKGYNKDKGEYDDNGGDEGEKEEVDEEEGGEGDGELFLGDDGIGLYYAGDFACRSAAVPPGVEAACLSAAAAAKHIAASLSLL